MRQVLCSRNHMAHEGKCYEKEKFCLLKVKVQFKFDMDAFNILLLL